MDETVIIPRKLAEHVLEALNLSAPNPDRISKHAAVETAFARTMEQENQDNLLLMQQAWQALHAREPQLRPNADDDYRVMWERDSYALSAALARLRTARVVIEDQRAELVGLNEQRKVMGEYIASSASNGCAEARRIINKIAGELA